MLPVSREVQPLSVYLGALGMTGMTAWAGLQLVEGIDQAVGAFLGLFEGKNFGKMVVKLA